MAPEVGLEPTTLRLTVARNPISTDYCGCNWGIGNPVFTRNMRLLPLLPLAADGCPESPVFPPAMAKQSFPKPPSRHSAPRPSGAYNPMLRTGRCTHRFTRPQNGQVSRDAFAVSNAPRRHQEPFRPRTSDAVELSVCESCGCTQQYRL